MAIFSVLLVYKTMKGENTLNVQTVSMQLLLCMVFVSLMALDWQLNTIKSHQHVV